MEEFLEFTTTPDDLSVASPKRGYSLSVVRSAVVTYDVGNASARQTSEEVNCDVIEVIGTLKTASRVVQMYLDTATLRGNKSYKVVFSAETGSGGPYTVTFSTGIALRKNVVVRVPSAGKSPVMFDLYVDKVGNVVSSSIDAALIGSGPSKNDIVGLTCSNATDTDHDITIAAGVARDSTDTTTLRLDSAITKQIDAAWAAGNNAGGLDTGTVAANGSYYVHLIMNSSNGSIDVLISASIASLTMPSGYTYRRLIGIIITDSSANIINFLQVGDHYIYKQPILMRSPTAISSTDLITYWDRGSWRMDRVLLSLTLYGTENDSTRYFWWGGRERTDAAASSSNFNCKITTRDLPQSFDVELTNLSSGHFQARGSATTIYFGYSVRGYVFDPRNFY